MIEALAMREHGFRDSLLFQLGLATAFRVSDLLSLKKNILRTVLFDILRKNRPLQNGCFE